MKQDKALATSICSKKVGSIDPISDFESMMKVARSGDDGGAVSK